MMEIMIMTYIAFTAGALMGVYWFKALVMSWVFMVYHTALFRTERNFYMLYDAGDDKVSYEWYLRDGKPLKKYTDYLRLHADARPFAYEIFREGNDTQRKFLFYRVAPIVILPAVIFWSNWYAYIFGAAFVFIARVLYELIRNGYSPGFYQRIVIFATMSSFSKKRLKKSTKRT